MLKNYFCYIKSWHVDHRLLPIPGLVFPMRHSPVVHHVDDDLEASKGHAYRHHDYKSTEASVIAEVSMLVSFGK